jgi:hypothetical protein
MRRGNERNEGRKLRKTKEGACRDRERPKAAGNGGTKKKGWSDIFDNLTYSSGPGDNIYVFG